MDKKGKEIIKLAWYLLDLSNPLKPKAINVPFETSHMAYSHTDYFLGVGISTWDIVQGYLLVQYRIPLIPNAGIIRKPTKYYYPPIAITKQEKYNIRNQMRRKRSRANIDYPITIGWTSEDNEVRKYRGVSDFAEKYPDYENLTFILKRAPGMYYCLLEPRLRPLKSYYADFIAQCIIYDRVNKSLHLGFLVIYRDEDFENITMKEFVDTIREGYKDNNPLYKGIGFKPNN